MTRRIIEWLSGTLLLALALAKALSADTRSDPLILGVGAAETVVGLAFVAGRTPRTCSVGLVGLGLCFSVWVLVRGPETIEGKPCGCFGPLRVQFLSHLGLSTGLLLLGALHCYWIAGSVASRTRESGTLPPRSEQ